MPVQHFDVGLAYATDHYGLDSVAGAVAARVHDARARVCCLAAQCDLTVCTVEGDAQIDESTDAVRRFPHQHLDRVAIAEACPRGQRVAQVRLDGIAGAEGGGDTALRISGVGLLDRTLGDNDGTAVPRSQERRVEPGDSRAQHAVVVIGRHATA